MNKEKREQGQEMQETEPLHVMQDAKKIAVIVARQGAALPA